MALIVLGALTRFKEVEIIELITPVAQISLGKTITCLLRSKFPNVFGTN
jgi:hypothetical protein